MGKKPILIIDGDEPSQQIISEYLENSADFFIAHICNNGKEAETCIESYQPSLIFMEIDLPGQNGFSILENLQSVPPIIITATQEIYAAKAFTFNAVDYLLKPFARYRFEQALHKFKKGPQYGYATLPDQNFSLPASYPHKILVEKGKRFVSLSVDEITHMKAEKDYTKIFTLNKEVFLSGYGISHIEKKMDPVKFMRIHRSYLINVEYIKELYRDISKLFVALPNDVAVSVGRHYLPSVKQLMF